MIGATYLERGQPVTIVARWAKAAVLHAARAELGLPPITAFPPRNVIVRRVDGTLVARPFRGLRRARGAA